MQTKLTMPVDRRLTIQEAADEWLRSCKAKGLRPATLTDYRGKAMLLVGFLGPDRDVRTISRKDVQAYIEALQTHGQQNGRGPGEVSIQSYMMTARVFIYWCMEEGLCEQFHISLPRAERPIKQPYSPVQMDYLLKEPNVKKCTFTELKCWFCVSLIYGTGARIGTVLEIVCGDVDEEQKVLRLSHMKARKSILVPISDELVARYKLYQQYRQGSPDEYLICSSTGGHGDRRTLERQLQLYGESRGVEGLGAHRIRHTYAREYILAGGDVTRLSRILGHSSIAVTNNYLRSIGMDVQDLKTGYDDLCPLDSAAGTQRLQRIKMRK